MSKQKNVEVTYVSEEEREQDDFKPPASYFVINALGEGVYLHTRDRNKAQEAVDNLYGAGKYVVRLVIKASVR